MSFPKTRWRITTPRGESEYHAAYCWQIEPSGALLFFDGPDTFNAEEYVPRRVTLAYAPAAWCTVNECEP